MALDGNKIISGAQQYNENICNLKRVKEKCRPLYVGTVPSKNKTALRTVNIKSLFLGFVDLVLSKHKLLLTDCRGSTG